MNMPIYSKSLLSLVSSVLKYYGVPTEYSTLSDVDKLLNKGYKNVVIMLFDGMGDAILRRHSDSCEYLIQNEKDIISSVFPPTTTAATTTMVSGLSPIEHGWLGWTLRFKDINKNVCLFPNTEFLLNTPAADYNVAEKYLGYESVFEKIRRATDGKIRTEYISAFSEHKADTLDDILQKTISICNDPEKKYIYTYYKQPDFDMHDLGVGHERVKEDLQAINNAVEELAKNVDDTLIIVTADHGLIDVEWDFLPEYPDIWDCLETIPQIETRAMTLFVKKGLEEQFANAFNKHFAEDYELMTTKEALYKNIFGTGKKHPLIDEILGQYVAVAKGKCSIALTERTDDVFKAAHAGTTDDEYRVPLIIIEKPKTN